jgi:antitoxin MazE
MKDAEFSLQQQVNITVTRGRIVIEPAETLEFNLEKLVAGISPENIHAEIVFGGPVGKEAL